MQKEAEIETELLRQIVVEEEWERQEAEVVKWERVAEELQKLEEGMSEAGGGTSCGSSASDAGTCIPNVCQ